MFFQTIYPMLAAGADLSINIKRVNDRLSVAVMPRHNGVKDESQQHLVPLILNGTAIELDAEFLQAIMVPVSRTMGVLANLETFERQAAKVSSESRPAKTAQEKESKEAREKREKMERLLKKTDEAVAGRKYSEALIWLKQARVLAPATGRRKSTTVPWRCGKWPMREACSPYSPNQSPQHSRSRYHNRPGPCHPLLRFMEDGNRLPRLNRRTDRCGCSHRSSRYSRNTAARTLCRTTTRISATDAGRTALLSTARTGRAATDTGTARHGTRVPNPATGHAGSIQLRQGRRERQGTAPQRPLCGIHRLPGRIPGEGRGADGTRMLLT